MLSQHVNMFSVYTHRLNKSIDTLSKIKKSCWDDGYEQKNIHAYTKR